jgi:hypothetical protein
VKKAYKDAHKCKWQAKTVPLEEGFPVARLLGAYWVDQNLSAVVDQFLLAISTHGVLVTM